MLEVVSITKIQSSGAFITRLRTDQARRFIARFIAFELNLAADLDKVETEGEKQAMRTSRDKKGIPPKIIAMNKQSMECEIPVSQNIILVSASDQPCHGRNSSQNHVSLA